MEKFSKKKLPKRKALAYLLLLEFMKTIQLLLIVLITVW